MNMNDIKIGMRVRVEFQNSAEDKINLPKWAISRRRSDVAGTVVSRIAEQGGDAWWVQLDQPEEASRSMRRQPSVDKDHEIKKIVGRRYHKAPYISAELHAL